MPGKRVQGNGRTGTCHLGPELSLASELLSMGESLVGCVFGARE